MRKITYQLFILLCVLLCNSSYAQTDPTTWDYEVKKTGTHQYDLIFHLTLKEEWHIWALVPGGDGLEIPPSFTFEKNPKVHLKGRIVQKGRPITTTMEGIDGIVTYYSGKVDYVQTITTTGSVIVNGSHEYQVCNNSMCLAPKKKSCKFEIK